MERIELKMNAEFGAIPANIEHKVNLVPTQHIKLLSFAFGEVIEYKVIVKSVKGNIYTVTKISDGSQVDILITGLVLFRTNKKYYIECKSNYNGTVLLETSIIDGDEDDFATTIVPFHLKRRTMYNPQFRHFDQYGENTIWVLMQDDQGMDGVGEWQPISYMGYPAFMQENYNDLFRFSYLEQALAAANLKIMQIENGGK